MGTKLGAWIGWQGEIVCLALVGFIISGCEMRRGIGKTEGLFLQPALAQESAPASSEAVFASHAGQSTPGAAFSRSAAALGFIDHTREGCPPELLTKGTKVLGEPVAHAWNGMWRPQAAKRLYVLVTASGKVGIFLEMDGDYIHLNSQAELLGINGVMAENTFTRADFNDPEKVNSLLSWIARLHQGKHQCPASSVLLRSSRPEFLWLRGTEKSEAVFRELCEDPVFTFEGNTWTVEYNVFRADGAVDRWRVIGDHDPQRNSNEILNIEVTPLKPPGTFFWPFIG